MIFSLYTGTSALIIYISNIQEPRNIVQLCTRSTSSPPSKSEDVAVEIVAVVVVEVLAVVLEVLVLVPLLITVLGVPKRKSVVEVLVVEVKKVEVVLVVAVEVEVTLLQSKSCF